MEELLDLNERLLDALTTVRPARVEELEYLRAGLSRWREQVATLRQRINGLAERGLLEARALGSAWKQLGVVTQRLWGKRDASLGPSVRLVRPALTAGGY